MLLNGRNLAMRHPTLYTAAVYAAVVMLCWQERCWSIILFTHQTLWQHALQTSLLPKHTATVIKTAAALYAGTVLGVGLEHCRSHLHRYDCDMAALPRPPGHKADSCCYYCFFL